MGQRVSAHDSICEMYEKTRKDNIESVFDRHQHQQPQCSYGQSGICCQLCSHGPCRITRKASRGICGATPDTIASRNLLRLATQGIAAYTIHFKEVIKTLRATAEGKTPFKIKEPEKLKWFARSLGLVTNKSINKIALELADFLEGELNRPSETTSKMVETFAPKKRMEVWKGLGILPGGPLHEILDATAKTLTSIDTDPVDLLLTGLRLAISSTYVNLIGLEMVQDILFGTPKPAETYVDLGIINPECVNIVVIGHEPFVEVALIQQAKDPELIKLAKGVGANSIRIIGQGETGQELIQRFQKEETFAGEIGNWIAQEFLLATGAVDLVLMDMNCSIPALTDYSQKYGVKLVSVSKIVRLEGGQEIVEYEPDKVGEQAKEFIKMGIEHFKMRDKSQSYVPKKVTKAISGFSTEAVLQILGGSLQPLIEAIKEEKIKGIVGLVSCTDLRNGHDITTIAIAKELIKRNILIVSGGCGSAALQVGGLDNLSALDFAGDGLREVCKKLNIPPILNFGTCSDTGRISMAVSAIADALGVDIPDLPAALTAPEYLEQKAVVDGLFSLAFGLYTHIAPTPPLIGAKKVMKILTEDLPTLTGAHVNIGQDPIKVAEAIEEHINSKRRKLGLPVKKQW